jgi:hypothetical protein
MCAYASIADPRFLPEHSLSCVFECTYICTYVLGGEKGDQIGRIFAHWVFFFFWAALLKITEIAQILGYYVFPR